MPYHKNKQQAFQAAQQGVEDVEEQYYEIVRESARLWTSTSTFKTRSE